MICSLTQANDAQGGRTSASGVQEAHLDARDREPWMRVGGMSLCRVDLQDDVVELEHWMMRRRR